MSADWASIFLPVGLVMLVRLLPAWFWPTFTSDAGYHLLMRREIRNNGFRIPRKLTPCVFDEQVTYPWLYHQWIAFLPETWLRRVPALPSAVIDGCHAALAYLGGAWLATSLGHPGAAPQAGFWSAILFGINPALLAHGLGPRAYEMTPRPLGELFFSMLMLAAIWAAQGGGVAGWVVSALAGGALLLSSKFAAQVLAFFVPLLALVPGFHAVAWMLPASFVTAMLLSRGRYFHVLRGQIVHLRWYRRKQQYATEMISGRNRWREIQQIGSAICEHGLFSREVVRSLGRAYTTNTYLLALSRGGLFLVLLFICTWTDPRCTGMDLGAFPSLCLLAWAFIWVFPFVLTSMRHYRFLGEAERYAEYGILPAAILVGVGLAIAPPSAARAVVLLLYALSAVGVVGHAWAINARASRTETRDRDELVDALRKLPAGSTLLGIPAMHVLAPVAFRLPHRYADITTDGVQLIGLIENRFQDYPWPKPDWEMWRSLGVDYVVTFSPEFLRATRPSLPYDRIPLELAYANPSYRVYAYSGDAGLGEKMIDAATGL